MEDIVCLDTTKLIDLTKGKIDIAKLKDKKLFTTQINAFELACGGESEKDINMSKFIFCVNSLL